MRHHTIVTRATSLAVCIGILLSNSAVAFDGVRLQSVRDVELTVDGSLQGQVYTPDGQAVDNAPVELRYQGTTIARATTGSRGDFVITGVRGGVHEVAVGAMNNPVRLWKNGTAPSGAVAGYVVAANENIVRGQAVDLYGNPCNTTPPTSTGFGLIDVVTLAMLGTSVAALVVAIDTNQRVDDLEDALASP